MRGDTVLEGVDEAERLLDELREAGVDYDDVVADARGRGRARSSSKSFDELIAGIRAKQGELATA